MMQIEIEKIQDSEQLKAIAEPLMEIDNRHFYAKGLSSGSKFGREWAKEDATVSQLSRMDAFAGSLEFNDFDTSIIESEEDAFTPMEYLASVIILGGSETTRCDEFLDELPGAPRCPGYARGFPLGVLYRDAAEERVLEAIQTA